MDTLKNKQEQSKACYEYLCEECGEAVMGVEHYLENAICPTCGRTMKCHDMAAEDEECYCDGCPMNIPSNPCLETLQVDCKGSMTAKSAMLGAAEWWARRKGKADEKS